MLQTFARVTVLGRVAADSIRGNPTIFTLVTAKGNNPTLVIQAEVFGELATLAFHTLRAGVLAYVEGELLLVRKRHRDGTTSERYSIRVASFTVVTDEAERKPEPPAKTSEPAPRPAPTLFGHALAEPEPV